MLFKDLQKKINYQFKDPRLLIKALTHRSYVGQKDQPIESYEHNERFEFLGDAVLELSVTEYLFHNYTEAEGHLTALRASLVNSMSLFEVGCEIGLPDAILISRGEREEYGKARQSIVTDGVEALIGAIYLDSSYQEADKFIKKFILTKLDKIIADKSYKDSKTKLQETIQRDYKLTPKYKILKSLGKDHEKTFEAGVYMGKKLLAVGSGNSKQEAETSAAEKALDELY